MGEPLNAGICSRPPRAGYIRSVAPPYQEGILYRGTLRGSDSEKDFSFGVARCRRLDDARSLRPYD
jgi:hypothetical protein